LHTNILYTTLQYYYGLYKTRNGDIVGSSENMTGQDRKMTFLAQEMADETAKT